MYQNVEITHLPQVVFPKYTVVIDGVVVKTANNIDPSEMLDLIGMPHKNTVIIQVPDETK